MPADHFVIGIHGILLNVPLIVALRAFVFAAGLSVGIVFFPVVIAFRVKSRPGTGASIRCAKPRLFVDSVFKVGILVDLVETIDKALHLCLQQRPPPLKLQRGHDCTARIIATFFAGMAMPRGSRAFQSKPLSRSFADCHSPSRMTHRTRWIATISLAQLA